MAEAATSIHALAEVSPGARLGAGVTIGPFCVVGPDVELGDGVTLVSHASVTGHTRIGARTVVHPFAAIGGPPQDISYKGEPTRVVIGAGCTLREGVTVSRGSPRRGTTTIGDRAYLMAQAHVAHDCTVGDDVIFANAATLAGHVAVGNHVFLGGLVAVHQHTRIGDHAMVGGMTGVKDDVIPFGMAFGWQGMSGRLFGLNVVGMRRRGFSRDDIKTVRACYGLLFHGEGAFVDRLAEAEARFADHPAAGRVLAFIAADKKRPLMKAAPKGAEGAEAAGDDD